MVLKMVRLVERLIFREEVGYADKLDMKNCDDLKDNVPQREWHYWALLE